MDQTYERIRGTLIGCAYGDAMGMPTEMMTRVVLERAFPNGIHEFQKSSELDFFGRRFPAGEITDDTINTLLVCDTIFENHGEFETDKYVEKLQSWIEHNAGINPYVIGPNTAKALDAIKKGMAPSEAGKYGTTNGSVMKVSPIGILYNYHDKRSFVDKVESLCLPTHHTSIAIAGASFAAGCISYAVRGGNDFEEMITAASELMQEGMTRGSQLPSPSIFERIESMKELETRHSDHEFYLRLEGFYGSGMETIETLPAVYAMLVRSKCNPVKTAQLCANMSGDSDTIGAIATAIAGAINPCFKEPDIQVLESINHIQFDEYAAKLMKYMH